MGFLSKDLRAIDRIYSRMETLLSNAEDRLRRQTPVSCWSAAQHLDHILIANRWALSNVVAMLRGHRDRETSGRLTLLGVVLLRVGRIPRGRARAPATSEPDPDTSVADLRTQLRKQKGYLATIRDAADEVSALETRFRHPYFGLLRATDGVRFMRVHSDHHLRIVDEILARAES